MHPKHHHKLSALYLVAIVAGSASIPPPSARAAADRRDSSGGGSSPTASDDFALREDDFRQSRVVPTRSLTLSECFTKADEYNKQIIAARYNLPIAEAGVKIAAAIPNPRFSLLYGWGQAFTIIIAGNPQQFGWMQQIQTAGKRTKAIDVARANLGVSGFQIAATMFDVHNRVRRAYAEQAAAEAYVELIDAERKVALDLMRTSERRFTAGKIAKSEVLQAQLGVLQFDTQRNQAQARLQQATANLALLIGETPEHVEVIDVEDNGIFKLSAQHTDIVPQVQYPLPPLEQLLPVALNERPDLKAAIQQAYADRKLLTLARSKRIPDLFVDAGYQFTTFKKHQPYQLFEPPNPTTPVPLQSGAYLNITAEAPLFYHHQGETDLAKATWLQDFDENQQLRFQIATDIVSAYEATVVTRANIFKFQQDLIPQAATVARLARRSYEVGKTDLASAILAKQQYQQTLSSYFDAVVAYQTAWADLEKAVGVSLKL